MKYWFVKKDKKLGDLLPGLQKDVKSQLPNIGKSLPNLGKSIDLNVIAKGVVTALTEFAKQMQKDFNTPSSPERRMKYPYTFTAKLVQFPYMHFYKNNWIARSYPLGVLACAPLFWYFSGLANSPANKATWKAIRRREREEAHHKFD